MKDILFIFFALFICNNLIAKNIYFSSSIGNDNHTFEQAQNPNTPWESLDKLNQSMDLIGPGDNILFKRGDAFIGTIILTRSGTIDREIVFGAFGEGPDPIISGGRKVVNWSNIGNNVWVAECPTFDTTVSGFFINGIHQQIGRYPNFNDQNKGYLNIDSHIGRTIISNEIIKQLPDLTGATTVLRIDSWIINMRNIKSHVENTVEFSEPTTYDITDNHGFFIKDHIWTLDIEGEWYCDETNKKIYIYRESDPNFLKAEVTAIAFGFYVDSQENFRIEDLEFYGSAVSNIYMANSNYITLKNNVLRNSGNNGVDINYCNKVSLLGNQLLHANNNAVLFNYCDNITVEDNIIKSIGLRPGMGYDTFQKYSAIFARGNSLTIKYNVLDSIGYNGVYYLGSDVLIENNVVDHFCMTLEDGGGLYTWNGDHEEYYNRVLKNNIIMNAVGAVEGTDDTIKSIANGIFLDAASDNISIVGNTVFNCKGRGVFYNFANDVSMVGNNIYNNDVQLFLNLPYNQSDATIEDCLFYNNVFFSKQSDQWVSYYVVTEFEDVLRFGKFDFNRYCRPTDDNETIQIYASDGISEATYEYLDFPSWKEKYNYDSHGSSSPVNLPVLSWEKTGNTNLIPNSSFDFDIIGWTCWSPHNNCRIFWDQNGLLTDGCLGFGLEENSGEPNGYMNAILSFNEEIREDQDYLLEFSMLSSQNNRKVTVHLSNPIAPYAPITIDHFFEVDASVNDYELLFSPKTNVEQGRIDFLVKEDSYKSVYWLDDIELTEAESVEIIGEDGIKLFYNPTREVIVFNEKKYFIDMSGNKYTSFELQPFTSIILLEVDENYFDSFPERDDELLLYLYPNPTTSILNVLSNSNHGKTITIYSISGSVVFREETDLNFYSIDARLFARGTYILRVSGIDGDISSTFIKL